MAITSPTPLTGAEQIVAKLLDLQAALQAAAPSYESLLHTIHVALQKDPEVVHLLTEEQVGILCAGLSKKKNVVIATSASKSSSANGSKKLRDLDIGTDL